MSNAAKAGIAIVVVIIAALAAYELYPARAGPTQTATTPSTVQIVMPAGVGSNLALNFAPAKLVVVIGVNNTIEWVNMDNVTHTVVATGVPSGAAMFASGGSGLSNGQTFTVTLAVPGTYTYHCSIHPVWMQGQIIVKQSA